ncbi:hypothetical protein N865_06025 [Intrasporangium oryzae NRRL B-24470]|uniref:Uncharacterized protein n=1 Tax=Intrasporangium oryzae NRRL B-24470 TaxID=1386089 RepID=W9G8L7_9MICO|nr:hypothetical protein [Intrasporangium oryzae]EWT02400.1 hypothetical protein N865_06025 [Intrasporangium oryzae NRRL B-24470]
MGQGVWRIVGIVLATLGLLGVAGHVVLADLGETHTVTGDLALTAAGSPDPGDWCVGSPAPRAGEDGIRQGDRVVVEDADGTLLAASSLGRGTFDGKVCVFGFHLSEVPRAASYRVRQGGIGSALSSYEEMVASDWSVHLTPGGG